MRIGSGQVAVVTGAASGIGRGLVERFADDGMHLVLADIAHDALNDVAESLRDRGARVLAVPCDVSQYADMQRLAEKAFSQFGEVHLVCNNAGVLSLGRSWEISDDEWQRVVGVNFWGVIHGIRAFVPRLLDQGTGAHIVNTASVAGLGTWTAVGAAYTVSKHAVVALSEVLYKELRALNAPIGVSVLCPGWVRTEIIAAERQRQLETTPEAGRFADMQAMMDASDLTPAVIAQHVVDAVREEQFYIMPDRDPAWFRTRTDDIRTLRNPTI